MPAVTNIFKVGTTPQRTRVYADNTASLQLAENFLDRDADKYYELAKEVLTEEDVISLINQDDTFSKED